VSRVRTPPVLALSRARPFTADPLLRSAYSLIANVVVTSGLGVGFWIAAARMFPASEVGRDSALVSAMMVVSTICALNLNSGLLRFLPVSKLAPSRVVLGSYALAAASSAIGAIAFVLLAPRLAHSYRFLEQDPVLSGVWVVAVIAWGVFALQDSVLTALRRAPWVPIENGVFGVLKFAALPALLAIGSVHAIFIAWAIPMILLLVPVNYLIFRRFIPNRPVHSAELSPIEQLGRRGLARFLANDYLAMILLQAGSTLLPVLVVGLIGPSQGAYFYMPFTIVAALDQLSYQVFSSLTVEGAVSPQRLPELVHQISRRFGPLLLGAVALIVGAASIILLPFGSHYVHGGADVLRILVLASPLRAVITLYCAVSRVRGRTGPVLAVQAALFVITGSLTLWLGSATGLGGVGLAWLIANAVVALGVLPLALAQLRQAPSGRPVVDVSLR
jgi:O-antigen/teichoic acid export membrane protein